MKAIKYILAVSLGICVFLISSASALYDVYYENQIGSFIRSSTVICDANIIRKYKEQMIIDPNDQYGERKNTYWVNELQVNQYLFDEKEEYASTIKIASQIELEAGKRYVFFANTPVNWEPWVGWVKQELSANLCLTHPWQGIILIEDGTYWFDELLFKSLAPSGAARKEVTFACASQPDVSVGFKGTANQVFMQRLKSEISKANKKRLKIDNHVALSEADYNISIGKVVIQPFTDSGEALRKKLGAGYCKKAEYGYRYSRNGLIVLFDDAGVIEITLGKKQKTYRGIGINDMLDRYNEAYSWYAATREDTKMFIFTDSQHKQYSLKFTFNDSTSKIKNIKLARVV